MNNIAIIPARGGSKRIKDKNIIDFCGKKMIFYAIEAALNSKIFDKVHISTDSKKIADLVKSNGIEIDFMRPDNLSDDKTGIIPVVKWVLEQYKKIGENYESIFIIMPTAPFIKVQDLKKSYELYNKHNKKYPLHLVSEYPTPIEWAYRRDQRGFLYPVHKGAYSIRSQDLQKAYYETGPFSIFNRQHIFSKKPVQDEGFISYIIPKDRAVDIDDHEDLVFAEKLFLANKLFNKENQ